MDELKKLKRDLTGYIKHYKSRGYVNPTFLDDDHWKDREFVEEQIRSLANAIDVLDGSFNKGKIFDSLNMPEESMTISFASSPVGAAARKLKAKWTIELEQDLAIHHGKDVEDEIVSIIKSQIANGFL